MCYLPFILRFFKLFFDKLDLIFFLLIENMYESKYDTTLNNKMLIDHFLVYY